MDATISVRSNHNPTVNQSRVCQQSESLTARLTGVRPTMNKTKEPTDISRGPQQQNSNTLIQQKPRAGNKDSELAIPRGPELVHELGRELDTTPLRVNNGFLAGIFSPSSANTNHRWSCAPSEHIKPLCQIQIPSWRSSSGATYHTLVRWQTCAPRPSGFSSKPACFAHAN